MNSFNTDYFRNIWNFSNFIGKEISGTLKNGCIGEKIIVGCENSVVHKSDSSHNETDFHTHIHLIGGVYYPPSSSDILLLIQKNINFGLQKESFQSLVLAPEGVYVFSISESLLEIVHNTDLEVWKTNFTRNLEAIINNEVHIDTYKETLEKYGVRIKFIKY